MALGSTQLLTEISTRDIFWGKGGRCVGLTTLPTSCADCLEILYKRLCNAIVNEYPYKSCLNNKILTKCYYHTIIHQLLINGNFLNSQTSTLYVISKQHILKVNKRKSIQDDPFIKITPVKINITI
jgi:hypothetical protein